MYNYSAKSSVGEIKERFDKDVERFSRLEEGQQATVDAPLCLELITEAAKFANPDAKALLDIGCGAGNFTLKMLQKIPGLDCTMIDLSMPMLSRAKERVEKSTSGKIEVVQADVREIELPENKFDIVLAGAVLHHLRQDEEWEATFQKIFRSLRNGGSFWISDLIVHDYSPVNTLAWQKYGEYLAGIGGQSYKEHVFTYIEKEDTPRSLNYQLMLLKNAGFKHAEILHKNSCFAAFGGIKAIDKS